MPTETLRPDGVASGGTSGHTLTGASTIWQAVNQALGSGDASLVESSATSDKVMLSLANSAIGSFDRITLFKIRIRAAGVTGASEIYYYFETPAGTPLTSSNLFTDGTTPTTYDTTGFLGNPNTGAPLTLADLNAMAIGWKTKSGATRIYDVELVVEYNRAPTTTISAPANNATVSTTTRPTITLSASDPDGDAIVRQEVRIYEQPAAGWTGFDPNTTTQTSVFSKTYTTLATSITPDVDLANYRTYRVYARVADNNDTWGPWSNNTFTVTVDAPGMPIVNTSRDDGTGAVTISGSVPLNMLSRNQADVETDTTGLLVYTNGTIARSTAQARHGSASLALTATADGNTAAATTNSGGAIPVTPGVSYAAMASFRAATAERVCRVQLRWVDSTNAEILTVEGIDITARTTAWSVSTVVGVAPANAVRAFLVFRVASALASEVFYIDRIALMPSTTHLNLLFNNQAHFEEGTTTGWTANTGHTLTLESAKSFNGVFSGKITNTSAGLSDLSLFTTTTLSGTGSTPVYIRVAAGQTITAVVHVLSGVAGRYGRLELIWRDEANASGGATATGTRVLLSNTEWTKLTVSATVPAGATSCYLLVRAGQNSSGTSVAEVNESAWIDGASIHYGTSTNLPPFWTAGAFIPDLKVLIARSSDGGATYTSVRNGTLTPGAQQTFSVIDYDAPRGVALKYRAIPTSTLAGQSVAGHQMVGDAGTLALTSWLLKDPIDPTRNMKISVAEFTFEDVEPTAEYEPLGRTTAVVGSDGYKGIKGRIQLWSLSKADFDNLRRLTNSGRTLLLQDIFGNQWYIRFTGSKSFRQIKAASATHAAGLRQAYQVGLEFREVAAA